MKIGFFPWLLVVEEDLYIIFFVRLHSIQRTEEGAS